MNPVTFLTSTSQVILTFLCQNPQQSFYSGEIADKTDLSKGGTNQSLHELAEQGVLKAEKKGRMIFYSVDIKSPSIRQYKVWQNIASLEDLVRKIKPWPSVWFFLEAVPGATTVRRAILTFWWFVRIKSASAHLSPKRN